MKFFFFGNYFYGICVIALSIEASLQQYTPLNSIWYYILVFFATIVFYTKAYLTETEIKTTNPRSQWYAQNSQLIKDTQWIYLIVIITIVSYFIYVDQLNPFRISAIEYFLIIIFPLVALLYYGPRHITQSKWSLRNIGWLKPFTIGFVWAGVVTVYPIVFYHLTHGSHFEFSGVKLMLFIKNLMYITMLCVLFDIKDYASDSNNQIKTYVVKAGLKKTIFSFVIPLTIIGWGSFLIFGIFNNFSSGKILINTIPFVMLILFSYTLHKHRDIFYYLIIIDGLMLVKAICGICGMIYF